ncbi:MAG TPA: NAD(P)H-dependent oxidoreductase subunit E [Bacteroidales bacterium]|nr:NAD(P)H-dependent oxidoreductase subunit E [Bacteroidales bacterium]HSA42493.1 NAD(P)H-dependent oxidoreductase subunit E [Bacteroidales bacterium]
MENDIDLILNKYIKTRRESLIPALQEIQLLTGSISEEVIRKSARYFGIAPARVYGLSTFYDQFRTEPASKIQIECCRGTACHLNHAAGLLRETEDMLGIRAGQQSRDAIFSIRLVNCLGGCNHGPVVRINGKAYGHMSLEKMKEIIARELDDNNNAHERA